MTDIYDTIVLCDKCSQKTEKSYIMKDGFKVRTWHCLRCGKQWYHPKDIEEYNRFKELKLRNFEVKLRPVGNSWTVSIPRDIIDFQEITTSKMVRMSMDEPGKVVLYFSKVRKIY